mmetsp:Transcript_19549/g.54570  ORF Transcript_19549/g.54570 Transcript_19549/m.54570 type:complete len:109 (-) Transcript_19549:415-741(-)
MFASLQLQLQMQLQLQLQGKLQLVPYALSPSPSTKMAMAMTTVLSFPAHPTVAVVVGTCAHFSAASFSHSRSRIECMWTRLGMGRRKWKWNIPLTIIFVEKNGGVFRF